MTGEVEAYGYTPTRGESSPVFRLRVGLAEMMDDAKALAEAGDWEGLIRGLEPLQQVLADLRLLESDVKRYIADTMPDRKVTVEGVGTVERKAKVTRKGWDSVELLRRLVGSALVDPDTGEIPDSPMEAADRILREVTACLPITGSTGWRVTALRDRGIDPDEWCTEERDGYSITFSRDRSQG